MINLSIYTDGSHIKGTEKAGFGACFISPITGKIMIYNERINQQYFKDKYKTTVSNPTAELLAAVKVIQWAANNLSEHKITIISDYIGVVKWITGGWKAKKPYIRDLVIQAKKAIALAKTHNTSFKLRWVRGHNGDEMNEQADELAKNGTPFNGFIYYLNEIKEQNYYQWEEKNREKACAIMEQTGATHEMGFDFERKLKRRYKRC